MREQAHWRVPAAVAAGALALAAGGCGGSSYDSKPKSKSAGGSSYTAPAKRTTPQAAGQQIKLKADPDGSLYFEPKALKAKAGAATLVMDNPASTGKEHGIGVKGNGLDKDGPPVQPGAKSTVAVTLKPGKYTFYCTYDGHAKQGMKGTLTVQ